MKSDRLRTINEPVRVEVALDGNGMPVGIRDGDGDMRLVEGIREVWHIDDEWWRVRISRRYVEALIEGGGRMVLFENVTTGEWFAQQP